MSRCFSFSSGHGGDGFARVDFHCQRACVCVCVCVRARACVCLYV